jgi:hypothetical protein
MENGSMSRLILGGLLLTSLAMAFSSAKPKITPPGTLRVYFSANREGEVEPCGCQVHQLGGLARLVSYFAGEKPGAEATVFVEAGDSFFALPEMAPSRLEGEKVKARLMAGVFKRLSLDAFTPGERDFAAGLEFLKELEKASGAVFLAANLETTGGKRPFPAAHLVERKGFKVGIVGVVGPKAFERVAGMKASDPKAAVERAVKDLKKEGADAIVVLSHQGLEADRELALVAGIDLVVGSHSLDALAEPVKVGGTAIVQTQNQGQQIGHIRLSLPERKWLGHEVANLDSDRPSDPAVLKEIEAYKESVRQIALKQSEHVAPPSAERPFVANSNYCRTCHTKQYDFWAGTKHASAIMVLYAKNQHFDPECIGCHSLGFQSPAGFSNIARPMVVTDDKKGKEPFVETFLKEVFAADPGKGPLDSRVDPKRHAKLHDSYWSVIKKLQESERLTQNYLGVQCEHCHGNRNGHPGEGVATVKKVSETTCKGCHRAPHAAPYDPKTFTKVACPLSSRS